jgi:hypothetical protein
VCLALAVGAWNFGAVRYEPITIAFHYRCELIAHAISVYLYARFDAAFMPNTGDALKRVKLVATMVETHRLYRTVLAGMCKLIEF